jgi:hypothetical protein
MCCLHMGACRNVGPWSLPPSVRGSLPCFGSEASDVGAVTFVASPESGLYHAFHGPIPAKWVGLIRVI